MHIKQEILDASIFLVDDSPTSLHFFEKILKEAGFSHITSFQQESQALVAMLTKPPDLVLLDMILHQTTAVDILKTLKNNIKTKNLPVIVLSYSSDENLILECLQQGAEDFIPKESNPLEVLVRINNILTRNYYMKSLFEKNRRLEEDIRFAAHVQEKFQKMTNLHMKHHYVEVIWHPYNIASGDFYFATSFPNEKTFFFLLDVSGHGVGAALVGFHLNFLTQQWIAMQPLASAEHLQRYVEWINGEMEKEYGIMGIFLSGIFGLCDEQSQTLHLISAGSPPPIIQTETFSLLELKNSVAIGVVSPAVFHLNSFSTTSWKRLLFFTDGIYEIQSPSKEMLSISGLLQILTSLEKDQKFSLANLYNRIAKEYAYHFEDDVTIFMLEKIP
ncbi:MAG: SpoIIE family protein phosphatase [Brevinematales bacterium]